ncbi:hypothetical protein BDZ89DRAFT_974248 [Hymenopellis radicata]|nr:hypothetical protein BDZ89DRAFT_974248 [Hymenopellis radicata]
MAAKHWFMQQYLLNISLDCTRSRNWRCEFYKKHARETVWMTASRMHLSPPRMVCYVHNIYDSAHARECHEKLAALNEEMGRATGCPPNALARYEDPARRTEYPLSASCAHCERDETATQRNTLKQCTRCKVMRFVLFSSYIDRQQLCS